MAAPRSTSLRALRAITQANQPQVQGSRSLHMTGAHPAPYGTPAAMAPASMEIYHGRSLADLRAECKKRSITASGSQRELADRLSGHDVLQQRAYSIAMKRFGTSPQSTQSSTPPVRHFNTSRAVKANNDSSTIDFAYMPNSVQNPSVNPARPRVPILPDAYQYTANSPSNPAPLSEEAVLRPEIYTVSNADGALGDGPSPMSEVIDNHAAEIDVFSITEAVGQAAAGAAKQTPQEPTALKQVWNGFLDDLLGEKVAAQGPRLT